MDNKDVFIPRQPLAEFEPASGIFSIADYRRAFLEQFNPSDFAESVLVEDLARRAAQMGQFESAHALLISQAGQALAVALNGEKGAAAAAEVAAPALVAASPRAESLFRQSLAASRGFQKTLRELQRRALERVAATANGLNRWDTRFLTEQACCTYLLRRFQNGTQACPHCGHGGRGNFIAVRQVWECAQCRLQCGIRTGTVMERSPLPLVKWFAAIRLLLLQPGSTTAELSQTLQIERVATIRSMAQKIREAMRADNASQRLADLDHVFLGNA